MELAPHARLGRRVAAATAIFVLLVFHTAMIVTGALNWNADCEQPLSITLIVYGCVGLLFIYLLVREWLYFARLSSLPSCTNLILLIIFYMCLCVAGGFLFYYVYTLHNACALSAPLLYLWAQAAVLFFACITVLVLLVPTIRALARVLLAPCALCLISCVETVGTDIEMAEVAASGDPVAYLGAMGGGGGAGDKGVEAMPEDYSWMLACCGPCLLVIAPFAFCWRPLIKFLRLCCRGIAPCGIYITGCIEACGCVDFSLGFPRFVNPFANLKVFCGPECVRRFAQIALAPGCIVPGRSLIALFVNTAALLWFFLYLAFDVYDTWEVVCTSRNPGVSFYDDPWAWLAKGAPSPIHWLLLIFAVSGIVVVLLMFINDMFTGPQPPPRSYYEAALWRGRRQVRVVGVVLLLLLFIGWGATLLYFVFLGDDCSTSDPSLYNVALLIVFLILLILALIVFLGCCVCLDCLISGRVRLLLLLNPTPPLQAPSEQFAKRSANAATDSGLTPGVPGREVGAAEDGGYGYMYGTSNGPTLVGAEVSSTRMCVESAPKTEFTRTGAGVANNRIPGGPTSNLRDGRE